MNGKVERDPDARKGALGALTGLSVTLTGNIIGDEYTAKLAKEGAEAVIQRLETYGYKITSGGSE